MHTMMLCVLCVSFVPLVVNYTLFFTTKDTKIALSAPGPFVTFVYP